MEFKPSVSRNLDSRNRGGTEAKKKLKKMRSIKLSKLSSFKTSTRRQTSQFDWPPIDLSDNDSSSKHSQGEGKSEDTSVNSSTYGSTANSMSSLNQDMGIKGGIQRKKTLMKSRSKKLTSLRSFRPPRRQAKPRFDQPSIILPDDAVTPQKKSLVRVSDASQNHLKVTTCSGPRNSENSQSNSASLKRPSGLIAVRILKNKASFKSKRLSMKKCPEISQDDSDSDSIHRATCSATLKYLKFPEQVELSERISVMKVCSYHHCSLNGHCHAPAPTAKHVYKRRHSLKTQKIMKPKALSTLAVKHSADKTKEFQTSEMVSNVNAETLEGANASTATSPVGDDKQLEFSVETYDKPEAGSFNGGSQENEKAYLAKILFGQTSHPEKSFQENLKEARQFPDEEQDTQETSIKLKDTSLDFCCIKTKQDKSISETIDIDLKGKEIVAANLGSGNTISTTIGDFADFCSLELSVKQDDKVCTSSEEVLNLNSQLSEDELSYITKRSTQNDFGESTEDNCAISSASDCLRFVELNASREEMNVDSEPENGSNEVGDSDSKGFISIGDREASATGHEAYKPQFNKENRTSMWHLIHQQMVLGLAAETGSQTLQGADEEKRLDDEANTFPETKSSGSCPDFAMPDENLGTVNQEIELRKLFAVKLVREAIEKILLPEVQDQSSDDQSITSDVISDQELLEKTHGGGSELSNATSIVSSKHNFGEEKEVSHTANSISSTEEEKVETKVGNKSVKQTPKSWSYLKKFILLKRFIKELEKVRKFDPRKPGHLSSEPEREAEKVSLRHQMLGAKKNTEEWMLDYALRQVVSQLAPTQKRKVALLVKAFETVAPPEEDHHVQVTVPKLKVLVDDKAQELYDDKISSLNAQLPKSDSELSGKFMEFEYLSDVTGELSYVTNSSTKDGDAEPNATDNVVSTSDCDPWEQLIEARKEKNRESEADRIVLQELPPPITPKPGVTAKGTNKMQLDKQNHTRMWHMIYQHVASNIAAKVGTHLLLLDGAEEEEQVDDATKLRQVKLLVQEAVDEILLPEIQDDSSDAQSIASDIPSEQELSEKSHGDGGELSTLNSIDSAKESFREDDQRKEEGGVSLDEEEKGSASDGITIPEDERVESIVRNQSEQKKPKSWSKLKKLIILKRSIKALENVKKLNVRPPQQLPLMHDLEAEKVDLRQGRMEERKKAEQWMLDYTVQNIVTKLTPARKRRVAMLVEAFEAVVPLPEI